MLRDRLITAGVLIPPALLVLYFGGWLLGLVAFAAFLLINFEYFQFATKLPRQRVLQLTAASALLPVGYLAFGWPGFGAGMITAVLIAFLVTILLVEEAVHEPDYGILFPAMLSGLCYTGVLGTALVVLGWSEGGNLLVFWLLMVVFLGDTGAYFGGRFLNGPKLSPRISPNKTQWGAVCGLTASVLASLLVASIITVRPSLFEMACYGFLVGVAAQFGDLAESLIKRIYRVKDAGTLLPGHGGLLDRIDGVLFAAPILFFVPLS